jgi:hypothetical protein
VNEALRIMVSSKISNKLSDNTGDIDKFKDGIIKLAEYVMMAITGVSVVLGGLAIAIISLLIQINDGNLEDIA